MLLVHLSSLHFRYDRPWTSKYLDGKTRGQKNCKRQSYLVLFCCILFLNRSHQSHYYTVGELIYTCKIGFLAGFNLQVRIKPDIFSRFSQPEHFSRFKPANLLLNRARFAGDNLCYKLTFWQVWNYRLGSNLTLFTGSVYLNIFQVQTWPSPAKQSKIFRWQPVV